MGGVGGVVFDAYPVEVEIDGDGVVVVADVAYKA